MKAEVPPVDFAHLLNWGKQPPDLPSARLRWFILILSVTNVVTVLGRLLAGFTSIPFAVSVCLSVAVCLPVIKQVNRILKPIEKKGQDLFLLSSLLHRVEDEPFTASLLKESQTALQVEGFPPSKQIGDLAFRVDWLHAMQNQFFLPLALLLMWRFQMAFALEAWRKKSGPAIEKWLQALGQIEALSSLAGYSFENPEDPFPEILSGPPCYEGEDLGHPLLPKTDCVHNDVNLTDSVHLLVVSGSNMSGKSTLLRTVGTNAVLALAGGPVCGKSLRLTPLQIGATLRVQDSLLGGRSRFFAEISKIRKILDRRKGSLRVLFLLDELFHGTNSHDRRIGAAALLKSLLEAGCIGLVTTHDLSLTEITAKVGEHAQNVHFADQFVDGEMHFDYKMRPGVVPHSNALALMRAIGLDV